MKKKALCNVRFLAARVTVHLSRVVRVIASGTELAALATAVAAAALTAARTAAKATGTAWTTEVAAVASEAALALDLTLAALGQIAALEAALRTTWWTVLARRTVGAWWTIGTRWSVALLARWTEATLAFLTRRTVSAWWASLAVLSGPLVATGAGRRAERTVRCVLLVFTRARSLAS